jgi:hypothetical protein
MTRQEHNKQQATSHLRVSKSGLFPCFFGGGGLTQAKNRAARATQKQVPVARSPPASHPAYFDWTARPPQSVSKSKSPGRLGLWSWFA